MDNTAFEAIGRMFGEVKSEFEGALALARASEQQQRQDAIEAVVDQFTQKLENKAADLLDRTTADLAELEGLFKELAGSIPEVKDGKDGKDGERGEDGQDRPIAEPITPQPGATYPKNTTARWKNGLWIACKEAHGTPDDDTHAWQCVIDGVNAVDIDLQDDHTYTLALHLAGGETLVESFQIPFPVHRGIHEEGQAYQAGEIVTRGTAMFQAMQDTADTPPGGPWQQILVAPRGKQGPRGKGDTGPKGDQGPRGPMGAKGPRGPAGKDATVDPGFLARLEDTASKAFEDDRSAAYAITSYRGRFSPDETYRAGDVVNVGTALHLCVRGGQYRSVGEVEGAFEKMTGGPGPGGAGPSKAYMAWRGQWQPGITYGPYSVVTDGGWTMVANRTTAERAGPQPIAPPSWSIDDAIVPPWDIDGTSNSIVYSGHLYQFTQFGWYRALRVWVPSLTATTNYRFIIVRNPGSENPIVGIIEEPVLNADAWTVLDADVGLVAAGEQLLIYIDALDSGSTSDFGPEQWLKQDDANNVDPTSGGWNRTDAGTLLRINKTDANDGDWSVTLNFIPNTIITLTDTVIPSNFYRYRTTGPAVDGGAHWEYPVVLLETGGGGVPVGSATDVVANEPVASPTEYKVAANHWAANEPSWANVTGFLQYDGVDQPGNDDTAFGIDLLFEPGTRSPDWDVLSISGRGVSGSGASGGGGGSFSGNTHEVVTASRCWAQVTRHAIPDGTGWAGELNVVARREDATGYYAARVSVLAFRDGDLVTQGYEMIGEQGNVTLDVRTVADGAHLVVQVRGKTTQVWKWSVTENYQEVS